MFCFQAIKYGRVYVLRYELCDDLPRELKDLTDGDPRRTMWDTLSPIALFASAENVVTKTNNLVPVAIQMDYTPGSVYLTIITRARVGYDVIANEVRSAELAIIILYPTSASGIIVL